MDPLDPRHDRTRRVLRLLGPAAVAIGLLFIAVGVGNFFLSFGVGGPPRYFWCAFVGMPILFVGVVLSKFGFLGAISRYTAGEVAPVGKDTFRYAAHHTRGAVKDLAQAVGEGLQATRGTERVLRCHRCNADTELPAKFCRECGAALEKTRACAACGELNDPDASFCDNCGREMARA